jgi:hypothetical protein
MYFLPHILSTLLPFVRFGNLNECAPLIVLGENPYSYCSDWNLIGRITPPGKFSLRRKMPPFHSFIPGRMPLSKARLIRLSPLRESIPFHGKASMGFVAVFSTTGPSFFRLAWDNFKHIVTNQAGFLDATLSASLRAKTPIFIGPDVHFLMAILTRFLQWSWFHSGQILPKFCMQNNGAGTTAPDADYEMAYGRTFDDAPLLTAITQGRPQHEQLTIPQEPRP